MKRTSQGRPSAWPAAVRVGYAEYAVLALSRGDDDAGSHDGFCQHDRLEIRIDPTPAPARQRETLLHEILHAVAEQYALGLSDKAEERAVSVFAKGLMAVFRDNPKLAALLSGDGRWMR